jgi:hypothetical protein
LTTQLKALARVNVNNRTSRFHEVYHSNQPGVSTILHKALQAECFQALEETRPKRERMREYSSAGMILFTATRPMWAAREESQSSLKLERLFEVRFCYEPSHFRRRRASFC